MFLTWFGAPGRGRLHHGGVLSTERYGNDGDGNLTSYTDRDGNVDAYQYDGLNRRTFAGFGYNGSSYQDTISYTWDNANRRTSLTLPNGVTVAYTYDADSHVTGLSYSYGGNQLGNLTYSYDADGRRSGEGGSLAAVNLPAAVTGNTFNADNGMTAFGNQTLTYDANGNLTNDGTNTYTWDARNHLVSVTGPVSASFVYDALGRRMSKTVAGATTQYLYDGLNPVQELDGASPPNVTANLLDGLRIDEYFSRSDTNGTMSFLADALGSTIALTDSSGALSTQYTYEPYGKVTASGPNNANSYQFTGRENDGTGLYYYRARYYSPTFQRFVSQDPIGFGGGMNLYVYGLDAPTDFVDRSGLVVDPSNPRNGGGPLLLTPGGGGGEPCAPLPVPSPTPPLPPPLYAPPSGESPSGLPGFLDRLLRWLGGPLPTSPAPNGGGTRGYLGGSPQL